MGQAIGTVIDKAATGAASRFDGAAERVAQEVGAAAERMVGANRHARQSDQHGGERQCAQAAGGVSQRSIIERLLAETDARFDAVARETLLAASERLGRVAARRSGGAARGGRRCDLARRRARPALESGGGRLHRAIPERAVAPDRRRQYRAGRAGAVAGADRVAEAPARLREVGAGFASQAEAVMSAARQGGEHVERAGEQLREQVGLMSNMTVQATATAESGAQRVRVGDCGARSKQQDRVRNSLAQRSEDILSVAESGAGAADSSIVGSIGERALAAAESGVGEICAVMNALEEAAAQTQAALSAARRGYDRRGRDQRVTRARRPERARGHRRRRR